MYCPAIGRVGPVRTEKREPRNPLAEARTSLPGRPEMVPADDRDSASDITSTMMRPVRLNFTFSRFSHPRIEAKHATTFYASSKLHSRLHLE